MLDHVFTDAIGALRDTFENALLERQAFEERFQADVLLGDLTWETSYGLPGEGQPAAGASRHHPRLADVGPVGLPLVVHRRAARRRPPHRDRDRAAHPAHGAAAGGVGAPRRPAAAEPADRRRVARSAPGPTIEAIYDHDLTEAEYAIEVSYEGSYELDEATLKDGSVLDLHFGAMGGWIASTLVKLGDLKFEFLPPDPDEEE